MIIALLISYFILIPMDSVQTDHLKAYGAVYNTLKKGINVEWLLNYRGGSFLVEGNSFTEKWCILRGVYTEKINEEDVSAIYKFIENHNMKDMLLEKAPKIAVYAPPYYQPWDDAVLLALHYAEIPFKQIYDNDILSGCLKDIDWLHLHHEDFTGMYGKFYAHYGHTKWYRDRVAFKKSIAKKWGFHKVSELEHAIADSISDFVKRGGFLFAMCSAPITLDVALATEHTDILDRVFDGDPYDPDYQKKLDFSRTFAFKDFHIIVNPFIYEHTDVDVSQEAYQRGKDTYFVLKDFSAKIDPIPTLLTQDHTRYIKEFLGQDTGFRKNKIKKNVIILADVPGTDEAKYIYGDYGKGFFVFLGGHDPEDFTHYVGDPPTDLSLHKHSPGYRLILNNVLFPAAQKRRLKT